MCILISVSLGFLFCTLSNTSNEAQINNWIVFLCVHYRWIDANVKNIEWSSLNVVLIHFEFRICACELLTYWKTITKCKWTVENGYVHSHKHTDGCWFSRSKEEHPVRDIFGIQSFPVNLRKSMAWKQLYYNINTSCNQTKWMLRHSDTNVPIDIMLLFFV